MIANINTDKYIILNCLKFLNINSSKINTADNSVALEPVANIETNTINENICQYLFCDNRSKVKPGNKAMAK